MTPRKTTTIAGRRPDILECLEAWFRVADAPAGKLLPDRPKGQASDKQTLCDPFDLYCWQLVATAVYACAVRKCPPERLAALVAHKQAGGKFSGFRVYEVIQIDPQTIKAGSAREPIAKGPEPSHLVGNYEPVSQVDAPTYKAQSRPLTEVDRIGVDEAWIARAAYVKFRQVLQRTIDSAEPYVNPAKAKMA